GHLRAVLRLLHPLLSLFEIAEQLLLFLLEPFELPLNFLAFFFGLGRAEGVLQFFDPLVEIPLPAGQFAEPVEDLRGLPVGLLVGLLLRLIAVTVILQFQLLKLLLKLLLLSAAGTGTLAVLL